MLLIINADDPYLSSVAEDPGTLNLKSVMMFIRLISLWLKSVFFVSNVPPRYHAFVF